ncbi:hypothetical protein [Candidatus Thiothrix anitrata]|uniref:Arc-like DNA binding domain-containing protein n=1 Tax=Candidatus Thiothrix anitrata TaxID=2823902 RepID=A0ABX7X8I4_9GAMM|nr:hypothetical protein [Candidatus Thiothrix anitrata]QTR51543.1 hypothetical protein J8380_08395 [Candidatus Thiothrix anitrata]
MSEENRLTPYPLRIDPELRAELEAAAKNAGRSLQSEISRRLYASLRPNTESLFDSNNGDADVIYRIANDVVNRRLRSLGNEIQRWADSPLSTENKLDSRNPHSGKKDKGES